MRSRKRKKETEEIGATRTPALTEKPKKAPAALANPKEILPRVTLKNPGPQSSGAELAGVMTRLQKHLGNASLCQLLEQSREGVDAAAAKQADHSQGQPLPGQMRQEMEGLLNQDLAPVRVHTDPEAEASAELLGAKAYARGTDIYFGQGRYAPDSPAGQRLLRHELVHVAQQARSEQTSPGTGPASHPLEREADQAAHLAGQGLKPALRTSQKAPAILREEDEKKKEAPKVKVHGREIGPGFKTGVIQAGPFAVAFSYEMSEGSEATTLVLHIPDGVGVSFSPLGETSRLGFRISDPGGAKARSIIIAVPLGGKAVPKMRALFTKGSFTYVVIFQFGQ